ncbi:MAG: hypothetical protein E6K76_06505 [Candidatus Eisenbacteria bacterium]|uniref:Blue (type 1) copper domain-containing protein n=1 Tax=Eiseniibacteriota bacterium TaxID=2212470 RepID=A0A538T5F2_UNCEI|nr:MAG: hypothetical protein E6K76_06505 [Candidatus Eisenbacteria bacterium]
MQMGRGRFSILSAVALCLTVLSCSTKSNPVAGTTPDVIISIKANSSQLGSRAYWPSPDTVLVGTKVAWKNNDSMAHTSTQRTGAFTWDTGPISPGTRSVVVTMTAPGNYDYICTAMMHTMKGVLVVK